MIYTFIITFILLFVSVASSAVRLGLHVTQQELDIWRSRMTNNVNTINGITFQSIYNTRIKADADTFVSQSHPGGDGYWVGYTGAGCVPGNAVGARPLAGGTPYGRGNGSFLARSAFVFLLTGDNTYANPVRTELLNQITQSGTDFTNGSKWCTATNTGQNTLETVPWVHRLLLAYDYLLAGGYTGFSAGEKTSIQTWFLNAGNYWQTTQQRFVDNTAYQGTYDVPQDMTRSGGSSTMGSLYLGGPTLYTDTYLQGFNQTQIVPAFTMSVGLLLNNSTLILRSTQWAQAFLKVSIYDNGAVSDFIRWGDCTPDCPGSMWGHTAGAVGSITWIIDLLARTGDTSLYDYSGATQWVNSSGSTVSWLTAVDLWAKMANRTTILYGSSVAPGKMLTWDSDIHNDSSAVAGNYYDFSSFAANMYYQDGDITTAMNRALKGTNSNRAPGGCNDDQLGGCFSAGGGAWWPDLPFMYGNLPGTINPYTLANPPVVTIVTPAPPTYATSTSPLTILAGTASDDVSVTSVTCVNDRGGSCVVTGTLTWTASAVLSSGDNILTFTASDGTLTGTAVLTVTYTPPGVNVLLMPSYFTSGHLY